MIDIKEAQVSQMKDLGLLLPTFQRNDIIVDVILELVLLQEGGQMIEVVNHLRNGGQMREEFLVNHLDGVVTIKLVQGILDLL